MGFANDRRFMFVDENRQMLTQRSHHKMALIECSINNEELTIKSKNYSQITVSLSPDKGLACDVQIWSDVCQALKVSTLADQWISEFLGIKASMVYMPIETNREVDAAHNNTGASTSFTDGFPILLISEASLADLNSKLQTPLSMSRFRPNLVIAGCVAFQEDEIATFEVNGLKFAVKKPCARCVITTIDPETAEKGQEPLKTLAKYRARNNKIYFGQNVIHLTRKGLLKVGDNITIMA